MQNFMKILYEIIMIVLVILTIITLWMDSTYNSTINLGVWFIFFIDFLIRFLFTKKKWTFVKSNPFLIIAIIPFDQFFQIARIVRLLYFYRIKTIAKYYITPYFKRLTDQSLMWIIGIFSFVLLAKSAAIWSLEDSIDTFFNALVVVFSHLLFFGHRIFAIGNPIALWVLTITSIIGVVLQGLALQWAFYKGELFLEDMKRERKPPRAS